MILGLIGLGFFQVNAISGALDWENSMKEAGNMDSQILMFTDPPADDEGEDAEEPKLLLF